MNFYQLVISTFIFKTNGAPHKMTKGMDMNMHKGMDMNMMHKDMNMDKGMNMRPIEKRGLGEIVQDMKKLSTCLKDVTNPFECSIVRSSYLKGYNSIPAMAQFKISDKIKGDSIFYSGFEFIKELFTQFNSLVLFDAKEKAKSAALLAKFTDSFYMHKEHVNKSPTEFDAIKAIIKLFEKPEIKKTSQEFFTQQGKNFFILRNPAIKLEKDAEVTYFATATSKKFDGVNKSFMEVTGDISCQIKKQDEKVYNELKTVLDDLFIHLGDIYSILKKESDQLECPLF